MTNKVFKKFLLSFVGFFLSPCSAEATHLNPSYPQENVSEIQDFWESRKALWAEKGYAQGPALFDAMRHVFDHQKLQPLTVHSEESEGLPLSTIDQYDLVDFSVYMLEITQDPRVHFSESESLPFLYVNPHFQKIPGVAQRHLREQTQGFLKKNDRLRKWLKEKIENDLKKNDRIIRPELFEAMNYVFDDPSMQGYERDGRPDGLPTDKRAQQRLIKFIEQVLNSRTDDRNLSFLHTPQEELKKIPQSLIRERARTFLQNIQTIQSYTINDKLSIAQAFRFASFVKDWHALPPAFMQNTEALIELFHETSHHFPDVYDQEMVLQTVKVLAEVTHPMDIDSWGDWKSFVEHTLIPLVSRSAEATLQGQDPDDIVRQEGQKIARSSFNKRSQHYNDKIAMMFKESEDHFMEKIQNLYYKDDIFFDDYGKTLNPFDAVLESISIYPDGKLFKPFPYSTVQTKRYRLRYESIYADPYVQYLNGPDAQLHKHLEKITPLNNDLDRKLSTAWYDFKTSLENRLRAFEKTDILDLFGTNIHDVWKKLDEECFTKDMRHQQLGKLTMARLLRLSDAMQEQAMTPQDGLAGFYMAVSQNTDGVGVRCIDGINDFLNEMERQHVYIMPRDVPEETFTGVIFAKILRDARYETLNDALNALFPLSASVSMEVRTYGFVNTLRALRHPFGLAGQDPETTRYPFSYILSPKKFLESWIYGGTADAECSPGKRYSVSAFTPEKAARLIQDNVGIGKPISIEMIDTLINWDLDLREAQRQWKIKLSDGDTTFENDFFSGENTPHKAMKLAGYIKILQRFGYVIEYSN